jgi:hypothetical protein
MVGLEVKAVFLIPIKAKDESLILFGKFSFSKWCGIIK